MYAVIKTGGKQYRVAQGDKLRVETLDADEGASISLDSVLMVSDGENISVGAPEVDGASVAATILSHGRAKKIEIIKFRRRKHYRRQQGHRQNYTELEITGISGSGGVVLTGAMPTAEERAAQKAASAKAAEDAAQAKKAAEDAAKASKAAAAAETTAAVAVEETSAATDDVVAREPSKFLDAPDGDKDDLTTINGIGPVIEETLNGMGIFHYRQIAAFTANDIDNVNDELSFPGRIEREEWISQAEALIASKG